ncbi:MAG: hypothetical protein MUP82_01050 [Candidatus Marinimicrobia bacterium]|nr:hypothetical protein [Candidatus Neomarinimicrobiota bacterium]
MPSVFEKNPKKTIFVVVIILFIIMDFSLSIVYTKIKENRERVGLGIPHKIYHHDFIKNGYSAESGRLGDYELYTNSLGFKDKSNRKIARDTEKRRIVFLGDSFTEGILLNYQDTFVGIIDSAVASQKVEVLNAGRVSYSPIIYWRKLKYLIEDVKLNFDELVVFIDIADIDDEASYYDLSDENNLIDQIDPNSKSNVELRDYGISWLISNQNIENLRLFLRNNFLIMSSGINWIHDILFQDSIELQKASNKSVNDTDDVGIDSLTQVKAGNTWDIVLTDRRANWTVDDKYYKEYGERGEPRMIKYMDKLLRLTKENSIDLTVVVYPWPSQIWYEDLNSIHVQMWQDWCDQNDIELINLFPSFIEVNSSEEKKLEIISKYYVPYDLHFNKAGNKRIANELLKLYFNISEY